MTTWSSRSLLQNEPGLRRRASTLFGVAATTTGNHVLPGVGPTKRLWGHMIDVLCGPVAVLAPVLVTQEDRTTV